MKNILVICSRNKWRSKTAETIFQNHPSINVKSAGTSSKAERKVSQSLIDWAESIYVMEFRHKEILLGNFKVAKSAIIVLDIPDIYQYMDNELIAELKDVIS